MRLRFYHLAWLPLLALAVGTLPGSARPDTTKEEGPNNIILRFHNGSVLQPAIS